MPDFGIFRGFNEKLFGNKLYAGQLPTQLGLIGSEDFKFDTDYKAILDYATTQGYTLPSASQQSLQNQLVIDLKTAGVWSKLDTFAVFATDGDSDFALIDWINLSQYTAVNSPTFTTNVGFQGDGSSSYITSNYNPTINGVNYQLNDAGFGYYMDTIDTAPSSSEGVWSATNVGGPFSYIRYTTKRFYINSSSVSGYSNFTQSSNQFAAVNRLSSTDLRLYANGIETDVSSISSTGIPNDVFNVFELNFSDSKISMVYASGNLSSEQLDFFNAWDNYYTAL